MLIRTPELLEIQGRVAQRHHSQVIPFGIEIVDNLKWSMILGLSFDFFRVKILIALCGGSFVFLKMFQTGCEFCNLGLLAVVNGSDGPGSNNLGGEAAFRRALKSSPARPV